MRGPLLAVSVVMLLILAGGAPVVAADHGADGRTAVAITSLISGDATVAGPVDRDEHPLGLLERLVPEQTVRTLGSSVLVITFFHGQRFRLLERTSAQVTPDGLQTKQGLVVRLSPVAAAPSLSPIVTSEAPGFATAAARLRDDELHAAGLQLEPGVNEVVLAEQCVLAFSPRPEVRAYQVRVENEELEKVLELTNTTGRVELPSGLLQPGAEYYWAVCPLDKGRQSKCSGAVFHTLSKDQAAGRTRFATEARQHNEPDLLLLLAELNRSLGLHHQACDELQTALSHHLDSAQMHKTMKRFSCLPPTQLPPTQLLPIADELETGPAEWVGG